MNEIDVFLSYSSKDIAAAEDVRAALIDAGVKCWMAAHDVHPGRSYPTEIMNAIEGATMMILLYTANSNMSEHVANEVEKMFSDGKPIIVFMVEDERMCKELDYFLKRKHWLIAYPDYRQKLGELVDAVVEVTGKRAVQKVEQNSVIEGVCLKVVPNVDCHIFVDFQEVGIATAGKMFKHTLPPGEYDIQVIGVADESMKASYDITIEKDKLLRVELKKEEPVVAACTDNNKIVAEQPLRKEMPTEIPSAVNKVISAETPKKKNDETKGKEPTGKSVNKSNEPGLSVNPKKDSVAATGVAKGLSVKKNLMIVLPLLLILAVGVTLILSGNEEKVQPQDEIVVNIQTGESVALPVADTVPVSIINDSVNDLATTKKNNEVVAEVSQQNVVGNYEYVDLGLSVKWAKYNVGAEAPAASGNYYAWGEIETKNDYSLKTRKVNDFPYSSISGDSNFDVARALWGGSWRMPTKDEFEELIEKCKWEWTTLDGKCGFTVTGENGNSIFLPASGGYDGKSCDEKGICGYYWCATPSETYSGNSYFLYFSRNERITNWFNSYYGYCVRPVCE